MIRLAAKDWVLGLLQWSAIVFMLASGVHIDEHYLLWRQGQAAVATVEWLGAVNHQSVHFVFDVGSRKIHGSGNSPSSLHVDDRIAVVYLPSDPSINVIADDPWGDFLDNVLLVLIGSTLGAGLVLWATIARRGRVPA